MKGHWFLITVVARLTGGKATGQSVPSTPIGHLSDDVAMSIDAKFTLVRRAARPHQAYSWALDRIDQLDLPLDHKPYTLREDIDASGVDVYVVDTGIYTDHVELQGLVDHFYTDPDLVTANETEGEDLNGHGTHCAGIVAGRNIGVSNARLKTVKVFHSNGMTSIQSVYNGLASILQRPNKTRPAVATLSLGLPHRIEALNAIAAELTRDNVTVIVASGNQGRNACGCSPASSPDVITVASIGLRSDTLHRNGTDMVSPVSNYGSCCDILAPGENIRSSFPGRPSIYAQASGTSQAAPFVAGAAALYLAQRPSATPNQVKQALLANSARDRVATTSLKGLTPNRVLHVCVVG